jgi:uncharacterized protein YjaZ
MGKKLNFETKKKYVLYTLKWCRIFFGENERKRTKMNLEITERKRKIKNLEIYGNYCFYRNKMTIHTSTCETIHDLVSTVIHEYTHYLQSRNRYRYYEKNYYYSTNPYEKEARRNEEKYTKICLREIKKLL